MPSTSVRLLDDDSPWRIFGWIDQLITTNRVSIARFDTADFIDECEFDRRAERLGADARSSLKYFLTQAIFFVKQFQL